MRHGRSKAARKTLRYFERTVNLKSKPYYSVLLDATFLIAMIRITSNNDHTNGNDDRAKSESTIVSRIERVLQVNGGGGYTRDERLSGGVGGFDQSYNDQSNDQSNNNSSQHRTHGTGGHKRYNVRYFIPQEAVDEIETIIQTFKDRCELTKKPKKQREYQEKSKVFEEALTWIKSNRSKRHSHRGSGRCEVLPRLEALVEPPPSKKQKRKHQPDPEIDTENDETGNDNEAETITISASDAVRRHVARDDGREDPETNQTIQRPKEETFTRTYIVASQEDDLLNGLRMLGTVPVMRCTNNASVLILENPSKKGQRTDKGKEHTKWKGVLQNPAEKALVDAAWDAQKKNRVRITGVEKRGNSNRAKGPNPLSCKRKRASGGPQQQKQGISGSGESKSQKRRARAQRNKANVESSAAGVATASPKE